MNARHRLDWQSTFKLQFSELSCYQSLLTALLEVADDTVFHFHQPTFYVGVNTLLTKYL